MNSEADDPQYFRNYYANLDPGAAAVIENLKQQAKQQQLAELEGNYYKQSPDRGYDDHDYYGGRQQEQANFVAFNEDDYEEPAAQKKPVSELGENLLQAGRSKAVREDVPRVNSIRNEEPAQIDDEAYLNNFFGKAGGYNEAKERPSVELPAASEDGAESTGPKPSVWQRAGNFFKGIGHAIKMPYNLIRHGLIGANYNRWQMNRHARKDEAAKTELEGMNNPIGLAERKAKMGHDAFAQRANVLHAKAFRANKKSGMAGLNLMRNRAHYAGAHVLNNFTKAFSADGKGIDTSQGKHKLLRGILRAGVTNMYGASD